MQEEASGFVEGLGGDYFAAEVAEVGEPVSEVEGELGVQVFAELLGQGGAGSGGGDGDLEVSALDYRGEVEVAEGWVVHGVAEDAFFGGFERRHGSIDGGVICGGYDQEGGRLSLLAE